jgi:hypothetical protein
MADGAPVEPPKVQVEALKAFSRDVELAVLTKAKGYGSRPVSVVELRGWIDRALASNTDDALRPLETTELVPNVPSGSRKKFFAALQERVQRRIAELEGGAEPKESVKEWLLAQVGQSGQGVVVVPAVGPKAGDARKANLDELNRWLHGEAFSGDFVRNDKY